MAADVDAGAGRRSAAPAMLHVCSENYRLRAHRRSRIGIDDDEIDDDSDDTMRRSSVDIGAAPLLRRYNIII